MLARYQQLTTGGLLALALLWAAISWSHLKPWIALVGVILILASHALVIAIQFLALLAANRNDPAPEATGKDLFRAWLSETRAAPQAFCWRQPWFSDHWPDTAERYPPGSPGVLFIHGFVCNRGLWNRWLEHLTPKAIPFVAVNLEPVFGSIDDYAAIIEQAVVRLETATGMAPVVVAHSMGGLALRRWWREAGNPQRLAYALTLGTPHAGTALAAFAFSTNGRQMRRGGRWLAELSAAEPDTLAKRSTCFYSHTDNIVFPASTACWPGAEFRHLRATAHVAMVDHPEPMAELMRRLADAQPHGPDPSAPAVTLPARATQG